MVPSDEIKEKLSDFKVYSDAVPPFKQQIYTW